MALPQGIDFRSTQGFVTDPTNCAFGQGNTPTYPTTSAQGNTVGWEVNAGGSGDVTALTGDQAKLSGIAFGNSSTTASKFRIDLPSTGSYLVRVAAGRADNTNTQEAGPIDLYDTTTLLAHLVTQHSPVTGNTFYDATDVQRTSAADWVANNAGNTQTFSTTILRFYFGPSSVSNFWLVPHVWVEAASGATSINATSAVETWAGQGSSLNVQTNVAASSGLETWSGKAATVAANTNVSASAALETWSGKAATVLISGPTTITANSALETWSGQGATVQIGGVTAALKNRVFRSKKHVIYGG